MLKHYIKVAVRNLWKYKSHSAISIIGLAVGFLCFSLALLWIRYEKSYDNFHKDKDHIYLVKTQDDKLISKYSMGANRNLVPEPLVHYMRSNFPEIEIATAFEYYKIYIQETENNKTLEVQCVNIDSLFYQLFNLEILSGNIDVINEDYNSIAITEDLALKLFGKEQAIGKTILCNDKSELTIKAVIKNFSGPSNFSFDILRGNPLINFLLNKWNFSRSILFIKLSPDVDRGLFSKKIKEINVQEITLSGNKTKEKSLYLEMIPLTKLRETYPFGNLEVKPYHILLFAFSGFLLILCALFNYVILFLSRFRIRRREFALRIVTGSSFTSLFNLLFTEFLILLFIACLISFGLIKVFLHPFLLLSHINLNLSSIYAESLLYMAGVVLIAGFLFVLTLLIFRKQTLNNSFSKNKNHLYRKIFIVLQLTISIGFIFCTSLMIRQLYFLHFTDIGFEYKNIAHISLSPSPEFTEWEAQMIKIPGITKAIVGGVPLMPPNRIAMKYIPLKDKDSLRIEYFKFNETHFDFHKLRLLEGDLLKDSDPENSIVITETMKKVIGLSDPVGKNIGVFFIKGVVKDIHNSFPTMPARPVFFQIEKKVLEDQNVVVFRYEGNWEIVKKNIENWLEETYPTSKYTIDNSEEVYNNYFHSEESLLQILGFISLVCIVISLVGFVSLISLSSEERRKEIAIRKINGAGVKDILGIFLQEYSILLIISCLIAFPLGYIIIKRWIENYTLQTTIPFWIYLVISFAFALIIVLSVCWTIYRASIKNPSEVLKS